MKIRTTLIASCAIALFSMSTFNMAHAQKFSESEVNAVVDQLIKSGKLDSAIHGSINRYIENQKNEQMRQIQDAPKKARSVSPMRDHIYGNPKAEWSIIVYSDLECAFCQKHAGVPEAVSKSIGSDKINVVFRHFPLPNHGEAAKREAVASECVAKQAGNDGFFKFVNSVLKNTQLNGQGLPNGDQGILALAKESGVKDETAFGNCMQDIKMQGLVKDDINDGIAAGVTGTPGQIIRNNKTGYSAPSHGADRGGAAALEVTVRNIMANSPSKVMMPTK